MGFLDNFFPDHFLSFIHIEPDDIAAMGHQGSDIPVAQMKYPFNDFLFCLFNGSLFRSFADDGFDFIFRYIAFFGWFNRKNCKKQIARHVQDRYDGITDPGQAISWVRPPSAQFFPPSAVRSVLGSVLQKEWTEK